MRNSSLVSVAALAGALVLQPNMAVAGGTQAVNDFYGSYGKDVAIEVPGFRGIEPKIALSYSSGGANGFAGAGWDVSGFTVVERRGKGGGAPKYDSTDEYHMDGQKLIPCVAGMVSPGCSAGGQYTTEIESYTRIKFASNIWTITSRDGVKIELRETLPGPSGTFRWGIRTVTDLDGNTANYTWTCDTASTNCYDTPIGCEPECIGGQICEGCDPYDPYCGEIPKKTTTSASYLGGFGSTNEIVTEESLGHKAPERKELMLPGCYPCTQCTGQTCTSIYQECYPDTVTYSDVTVKLYTEIRTDETRFPMGGRMGRTRYRLKTVKVSVGSSLLRAYKLAYTTSLASKRSLLQSIQQVGRDATVGSTGTVTGGTSLPATTFTYQTTSPTFASPTNYNSRALFGNDGDARPSWGTSNYTSLVDMDGDGKLDFVAHWKYIGTTGAGLWVALNTGTAFGTPVNWLSASKLGNDVHGRPSYNSSGTAYSTLMDMNRDGRPDYVSYYKHSTSTYGMWVLINNGAGFNTPVNWNTKGLFNKNEAAYPGWASEQYTQLRDMNGDGYPDFISYYNWNTSTYGMWVAINNNGIGFLSPTNWGTRSKLGNDVHARPRYIDNGNIRNDLVDMNGDGLPDYVAYYNHTTSTYGLWVLINTGSGFANPVNWYSKSKLGNSENGTAYPGWGSGNYTALRDITGDGLPDFISFRHYSYSGTASYGLWVLENNGKGFESAVNWGTRAKLGNDVHARPSYQGDGHTYTDLVDMNNDGLLDYVSYHNHLTGTYGMWVLYNNGKGFESPINFGSATKFGHNNDSFPQWSEYAGLRDVNGDGFPDYVSYYKHSTSSYGLWVAKNTGIKPDMMVSTNNGLGGTTTITYTPYSATDDTYLPAGLHVQVVSSITTNDGRGNLATTNYSYAGALFDAVDSQFLGFHYVKATAPCITGETQCPYTETWFKQDYGSVSKPERMDERDGSGKLLSSVVHTYTTNGATLPHTSVETAMWSYVYDGSGTTCSTWPCTYGRRSYVTRTFDTYGNITAENTYGNYDVSGDETRVEYTYYPNTTAFIVASPALVATKQGTSSSGTLLTQARITYDANTSYTQAPTKGKATKTERWLNSPSSYVSTKAGYDAWGNVIWEENELGQRTTFTVDSVYHKYVTAVTTSLGQTATSCTASSPATCYDLVCGVKKLTKDLNNQSTTYQYDALCRRTRVDSPLGMYAVKTYNNFGSATTQYTEERGPAPDASGEAWTRTYFDGHGRTWRIETKGPTTAQSIRVDTEYTKRGAEWKKTAPYYANETAKWVTATYDQRDRVTRMTHADGAYVSTTYALGKVTTVDELGHMQEDTLDGSGNVTKHREWSGSTAIDTTHTYDARGQRIQTIDPKGNKWTFSYNSLGQLVSASDPDLGTVTKTYDATGKPVEQWDAKGQRTTQTYDALGRPKTRTTYLASGAVERTITINYDQARSGFFNIGRKTSMTDQAGTATVDWDAAGRMVKWTRSIDSVTYTSKATYDAAGRLLGVLYPDGDVVGKNPDTGTGTAIAYDGAGRMKTFPGYVTAATYTAWGALATQTNANGTVTTRSYDANRKWLSSINTVKSTTTVQNLVYARDAEGRITGITSPFANESWTYGYDNRDQLTSATNTSSSTYNQTFAYDSIGNMTSNSQIGTYTYPASGATATRPHAVATAGSNSYAYDASGNMTSGAGRTLTYSVDNMPTQIVSGGVTSAFTYDGNNQRIKKVAGGVTTISLGDAYEVSGGVVTKYVAFAGSMVAKKVGSTISWLHVDHLGSVQALTNSAGTEILRRKFKPYGSQLSVSGSGSEIRGYGGQRLDETGLIYMNARYYDPLLGRFISADPVMSATDTIRLNRYAYAGNNPVNFTDVDGLFFKKLFKSIGKFLKKVGKFLLKIAGHIARIPIIGSIVAKPLQFWGAVFTGNWKMAIQIVATVIIQALAQVLTVMTAGIASPILYVLARAAIGFAEGYLSAVVMGASGSAALKAGLMAGAFSAASAIVDKFKQAQEAKKAEEVAAAEAKQAAADEFYNVPYSDDGGAEFILVHDSLTLDGPPDTFGGSPLREFEVEFLTDGVSDVNGQVQRIGDGIVSAIETGSECGGNPFCRGYKGTATKVGEWRDGEYWFGIRSTNVKKDVALLGHVRIADGKIFVHIVTNAERSLNQLFKNAIPAAFGRGGFKFLPYRKGYEPGTIII